MKNRNFKMSQEKTTLLPSRTSPTPKSRIPVLNLNVLTRNYNPPFTDISSGECAKCNRRKESRSKSFFWIMCAIFAGFGLVYQLWVLSQTYLTYEVVTELSISAPTNTTQPALSACFPYTKILDYDKLKFHNPELAKKLKADKLTVTDTENVLTIQQIFDMAPKNTGILKQCKYRTSFRYPMHSLNNSIDCYLTFKVDRYYKQQYMCYAVSPRDPNQIFDYFDLLSSLDSPGLFFEVTVDTDVFNKSLEIQAIINDSIIIPRGNNAFPVLLSRKGVTFKYNQGKSTYNNIQNQFSISYNSIYNKRKPPPYTTNCFDYANSVHDSQDDCFDDCFIEAVEKLMNKVPFTTILKAGAAFKHMSTADIDNKTLQSLVYQQKSGCRETCTQPSCDERLFVTNFVRIEQSEDLVFQVYVMSDPPMVTIYKEKMSFSEYLVQFLSCFGIWYTIDFTTIIDVVEAIAKFYRYWMR